MNATQQMPMLPPLTAAAASTGNTTRRRVRRVYDGARLDVVEQGVLPRVRAIELPEGMEFPDTGCALHPSCLRCPRTRCIEDERAEGNGRRDRQIARLYAEPGARVGELAAAFGVTARQISRIARQQGIVARRGRPRKRTEAA